MSTLFLVVIASLAGGLLALLGGLLLTLNKKHKALADYATAFAAGALLAAAFTDLLPEAIESSDPHFVLLFAMLGLVFFFLLETVLHSFHKHVGRTEEKRSLTPMIIIGDTLHNFIDGAAIASGFLISPASGVVITLVVVAHEIPQEIGDFGVLLNSGMPRKKVIIINILSALVSTLSAVLFFSIGDAASIDLSPLLGIVAGFFIYIAATDIIPTIHQEKDRRKIIKKSLFLLAGVALVSLLVSSLHSLV